MPKRATRLQTGARKVAGRRKRTSKNGRKGTVARPTGRLSVIDRDNGRALELRARLGMNRASFARLVPMSTRNLAYIEAGKRPTANVLRQLQALRRLVVALSDVIQADAIGRWLQEPNRAFDGLKPIEVIERGEADRIWQMIFFQRSGVAS